MDEVTVAVTVYSSNLNVVAGQISRTVGTVTREAYETLRKRFSGSQVTVELVDPNAEPRRVVVPRREDRAPLFRPNSPTSWERAASVYVDDLADARWRGVDSSTEVVDSLRALELAQR